MLTQEKAQDILNLVRRRYPTWQSFANPSFVLDEVEYKQNVVAKAGQLLNKSEIERLLAEKAFDEILQRVETVGQSTNLLWLAAPSTGDLGILYQPQLDKPTFCTALFDLLYGTDPSEARLERYVEQIEDLRLPNKWAFPTYFLFMCHPATEMFVKPTPMRWFLDFIGGPALKDGPAVPEVYSAVKQAATELREHLAEYRPADMVDVQGLIWVAYRVSESGESFVTRDKRSELQKLFAEFAGTYPTTEDGQQHIAFYQEGRKQARQNLEAILAAERDGQEATEAVLFKLLPYTDTAANRDRGMWINIAPALSTDVRVKFEAAGWTQREDWPLVAQAILRFVRRCDAEPDELAQACEEFSALPYSKGFQTGTLTPILNALRPGDFVLINNKSRRVVNHFAGTAYGQALTEYPKLNLTARALVGELAGEMAQAAMPGVLDVDLFDMFSHWLVAVKQYGFPSVRYWKIAPGEDAWNWPTCRDGDMIAIGWDELGDISGMNRQEFNAHRDEVVGKMGWTKTAAEQVWKFAHIAEGDRIVVNQGTTEVLGIATVVGPYSFVPGERHVHRLPVEWDDLTRRQVDEYGWRKTLIELDRAKFDAIQLAPAIEHDLAEPFSRIFRDLQEAEWAVELLAETFERLGITGPDDERFALTLRHNERVLRLNFGNWAVLQFYGPTFRPHRVGIALIEGSAGLPEEHGQWEPFAQSDPSIRVYMLPIELVMPLQGDLRAAYERTFAHLAERFRHWTSSNLRRFNNAAIAEAVFKPEQRHDLLVHGLSVDTIDEPSEDDTEGQVVEQGYFSTEAFKLLAGLTQDPSKTYYQAHKEAFKTYLEEPFQQLFQDVAANLPPRIRETMETERRVFSRILKNDFGRGGAWDFYWGAFYPKGGKRTEGAQLSLWINHERLEFGFYIGAYGSAQRQRFQRNCEEHYEALVQLLGDLLADDSLVYGRHEDVELGPDGRAFNRLGLDWKGWLRDPEQGNFDASVALTKKRVLQSTREQLCAGIVETYARIFPLVLLATLDDPLPTIGEYLGITDVEPELQPIYTLAECAHDTGFDEETLQRWVRAVERKGQAIFYEPPGTGKTYVAEHLARHLVGGTDGFWDLVQFHPAYAYEDFVQGIRPQPQKGGGLHYPMVPGRFLDFCTEARTRQGTCVLIIDEINRANLARVLGELMYLLEYRDREVPLAGGGTLRIPKNVRLIGTMNTADRSIALVDHALRRRFAFLGLQPNLLVLERYHQQTGFPIGKLVEVLKQLNGQIGDAHYQVGISFFLHKDLAAQLGDIWQMEIEPYLEEYFFDQPDKVDQFRWKKVQGQVLP